MNTPLYMDAQGVLHLDTTYPKPFSEAEPICPICEEPIRWCLDMFSFTTGYAHKLAHAHCVWTPEAFDREKKLAKKHD
jgi:hypothetical protein